jgi:hypothetical protein
MKNQNRKKPMAATLAILLITAGCAAVPSVYSELNVSLPRGAQITGEEIKSALSTELAIDPKSGDTLELTIYDYSSGKERLTYSEGGEINSTIETGYIKALCVIRSGGRMRRAFFLSCRGADAAEMSSALKAEFKKYMR